MEPEYAQAIPHYDRVSTGSAVRSADVNSLCQQLERHIERAREASSRIRDIGDRVFGPRPEAASMNGPRDSTPTLSNLIDLLGEQIGAIENGLSRL